MKKADNIPSNNLFELKFTGGDITPDKVSSRELADLIIAFETTIISTIKKEHKDFKEENLIVPLVNIQESSLKLKFKPKVLEYALPALLTISSSIQRNDFSSLPYKTVESLAQISSFCKSKKCSAEFRDNTSTGPNPTAVITADQEITIPKDLFIVGETVVYGTVVRVGGVDPKVALKIRDGETLFCNISEDLAKEVGKGLYTEVGVNGVAKWLKEDYSIVDFRISSFFKLERSSLTKSFDECRNLIGKYWKDVTDVPAEISKIRGYSTES